MRTFYQKSRAAGVCKDCGAQVERGSSAWWSQKRGWQCVTCNGRGDQPTEEPKAGEPKPAAGRERVTESDGRLVVEYDRMSDAIAAARRAGEGIALNPSLIDSQLAYHQGKKFLNGKTSEKIAELVEAGDKRLTRLVEQFREQIANDIPVPERTKRKMRRGRESGEDIDPDRYLARVPEMWDRVERTETPSSRVTISINAAVAFRETQNQLAYRAAAAIALADALTERGVSVEIRLFFCIERPSSQTRESIALVLVKPSDQPLNVPQVAVACCEISAVRLGLVYGPARHFRGEISETFGTASRIPADLAGADFIVDRDVTTRDEAAAWVKSQIAKFQRD